MLHYIMEIGINIFLAGFVHTENLRFREVALSFKVAENIQNDNERHHNYEYPDMVFLYVLICVYRPAHIYLCTFLTYPSYLTCRMHMCIHIACI